MNTPSPTPKTSWSWWRLTWLYGGKAERYVIISFFLGCALMLVPFIFVIPISRLLSSPEWRQLGAGVAITGLSWTLFSRVVFEAMHGARFYRLALEKGDRYRLTEIEREYLDEWTRFKEAVGVDGQLPQVTHFALSALAIYFGLWLGLFPYVLLLYPLLGDWTVPSFAGFAVPLYLGSWVAVWRGSRRLLEDATRKGFRLAELRKQITERRGRMRFRWF